MSKESLIDFEFLNPVVVIQSPCGARKATVYEGSMPDCDPGWDQGWAVVVHATGKPRKYGFLFPGKLRILQSTL